MNSVLLNQAKSLYQGLILQKNMLNAELTNTTYQAAMDKSRIENGLNQIKDIKALIERQIHILSQNLLLKKSQVVRLGQRKEQSIEELNLLQLQLTRQKSRLISNQQSAVRQQSTNTQLSMKLLNLQNQNTTLVGDKQSKIQKVYGYDTKIKQKRLVYEQTKKSNINLDLIIQNLKLQNESVQNINLDKSMQIERFRAALQKSNSNNQTLKHHDTKLRTLNSNIQAQNLDIRTKLDNQTKVLFSMQTKLIESDQQFKQKVLNNRSILNSNQQLSFDNHHLYQQNRKLQYQFGDHSQILRHTQDLNNKLKHSLQQKMIINNYARSILLAPSRSSENVLGKQESKLRSMQSTGAGFN